MSSREIHDPMITDSVTDPYGKTKLKIQKKRKRDQESDKSCQLVTNCTAIQTPTSSSISKKKKIKTEKQSQHDDAATNPPIKEERQEKYFTPPANEENDATMPNIPTSDDPLFITDPNVVIRMNPTLFPSYDTLGWSARMLLPSKRTKKPRTSEDVPLPVNSHAPIIPPNCYETILPIDFTPDEYTEQMLADNYYAQGVKLVDGSHRVVFYHKLKSEYLM